MYLSANGFLRPNASMQVLLQKCHGTPVRIMERGAVETVRLVRINRDFKRNFLLGEQLFQLASVARGDSLVVGSVQNKHRGHSRELLAGRSRHGAIEFD